MFVKPSNSGSSVGVKKATNKEELKMAIENAGQYDSKILVEQGVNARELECAILKYKKLIVSDEKEIKVSTVGEILSAEEFNTMPGFTKISMYPKLFEAVGITYTELLDKLIENTK